MATVKKNNIKNLILGVFFSSFAFALTEFFLAFFLKEQGFSALQIGGFFTIGIAIGSLLFSVSFSRMLKKIELRTGLIIAGILGFLRNIILYIFPTFGGAIGNQIFGEIYKPFSRISIDTTMQHNLTGGKERETSVLWLIFDSLALILGIILSLILIKNFGFRTTFLLFALIGVPAIYFYSLIDDKTRFKPKRKNKLPEISMKLKLILFSEIIYWLALASTFSLVITFLVSEKLSGTLFDIGIIFIVLYSSITLTGYITKKSLDKKKEINSAMFGMVLLLISSILVIIFRNFYLILLAFLLEGIGAGIWVPSKTALQWKNTKKENREIVSGWLSGWRGFVTAFGPLIGGFLITTIGINAPFYFKGGISILSLAVYLYIARKD